MIQKYIEKYAFMEWYFPIRTVLDNIAIFTNYYCAKKSEYLFYRWRDSNIILRVEYPEWVSLESYNLDIFEELNRHLKMYRK